MVVIKVRITPPQYSERKRVLVGGEILFLYKAIYKRCGRICFPEYSFSKDGVHYFSISREEYDKYCELDQLTH